MTAATMTITPPTAVVVDDEARLVRRAQAGDMEAFGELYAHYRHKVHCVLNRLLRDYPSDVDDVASQVFLYALERIGSYEDRGRPFGAWLNGIIHFRVRAHRQWRAAKREDELAEPTAAVAQVMAVRGLSTEDHAILRLELRALLNSLNARPRLALLLRDWAGWSYEDIARALHLSLWATNGIVNRARRTAREAAQGARPVVDRSQCECGCGKLLPASSNGSRRFATSECSRRLQNERRAERARRRYLEMTDPATMPPADADPALDTVLRLIVAAGDEGINRAALRRQARIMVRRLDGIVALLKERQQIREQFFPGEHRSMRYYPLSESAMGMAA
jgi:RNA polymerase sigma-70 factor, ECF subfamily